MTRSAERNGITAALAAYTLWGLVPIFFKQLAAVPALEIIAHRVVWSLLLVGALLVVRGRLNAVWNAARDPRILARAALAAARRLPLATLGFLQYTAPSLIFLVAIFLYGEAMTLARLFAFAAIWAGLALYTVDLLLRQRQL